MIHEQARWRLLGLIPVVILLLVACKQPVQPSTVLIVRHAERASDAPNTNLDSDEDGIGIGVSRADDLAEIAMDANVTAVYTTQTCRTAQTGQPAAVALGLPLQVLQAAATSTWLDNCDPGIIAPIQLLPQSVNSSVALAQHVAAELEGQTVLIVGHSETVGKLVEAFGAPPICPTYVPGSANCMIPGNEFNHLFKVTIPQNGSAPSLTHQLYGAQ